MAPWSSPNIRTSAASALPPASTQETIADQGGMRVWRTRSAIRCHIRVTLAMLGNRPVQIPGTCDGDCELLARVWFRYRPGVTDTKSDLPAVEKPSRAAVAGVIALGGHAVSLLAAYVAASVVQPSVGGGFEDIAAAAVIFLGSQVVLGLACLIISAVLFRRGRRYTALGLIGRMLAGLLLVMSLLRLRWPEPARAGVDNGLVPASLKSMHVLVADEWRRRRGAPRAAGRPSAGRAPAPPQHGVKHPVADFLFTYYSYRPAQLRRWHPGAGAVLADADPSELGPDTSLARRARRST